MLPSITNNFTKSSVIIVMDYLIRHGQGAA